jgi:hypothetical protein
MAGEKTGERNQYVARAIGFSPIHTDVGIFVGRRKRSV